MTVERCQKLRTLPDSVEGIQAQIAEALCDSIGGDGSGLGFFPLVDGSPQYANLHVSGVDNRARLLANVGARPASGGLGASDPKVRFRRGSWSIWTPGRRLYNRFSLFRDDVSSFDDVRRLPIYRQWYGPGGIIDQVRMLVYDGLAFVGTVAIYRLEGSPSFTRRELAEANRMAGEVRTAMLAAWRLGAQAFPDNDVQYALFDADGHMCQATAKVQRWFDLERHRQIGETVRAFDRSPKARSVLSVDGTEVRLVRLDGDGSPLYLAAICAGCLARLDPRHQLTERQNAVAELASAGLTVSEMAAALEISSNTVKSHLKTVYRVLDLSNRAELAVLYDGDL